MESNQCVTSGGGGVVFYKIKPIMLSQQTPDFQFYFIKSIQVVVCKSASRLMTGVMTSDGASNSKHCDLLCKQGTCHTSGGDKVSQKKTDQKIEKI